MTVSKEWDAVFTRRVEKNYDEMKWLYSELYYGHEGAFDYFLSMLFRNYSERKHLIISSLCFSGIILRGSRN